MILPCMNHFLHFPDDTIVCKDGSVEFIRNKKANILGETYNQNNLMCLVLMRARLVLFVTNTGRNLGFSAVREGK